MKKRTLFGLVAFCVVVVVALNALARPAIVPRVPKVRVGDWFAYTINELPYRQVCFHIEETPFDRIVHYRTELLDERGGTLNTRRERCFLSENREEAERYNRFDILNLRRELIRKTVEVGGKAVEVVAFLQKSQGIAELWYSDDFSIRGLVGAVPDGDSGEEPFEMKPVDFGNYYDSNENAVRIPLRALKVRQGDWFVARTVDVERDESDVFISTVQDIISKDGEETARVKVVRRYEKSGEIRNDEIDVALMQQICDMDKLNVLLNEDGEKIKRTQLEIGGKNIECVVVEQIGSIVFRQDADDGEGGMRRIQGAKSRIWYSDEASESGLLKLQVWDADGKLVLEKEPLDFGGAEIVPPPLVPDGSI